MKNLSRFQTFGVRLSTYLWPEVCPFCLKPCRDGICPSCRRRLEKLAVKEPVCKCCGRPIRDTQTEFCRDCKKEGGRVFTRGASAWLHRDSVGQSLYQFKYHDQRAFVRIYAKEITARYAPLIKSWQVRCLIPVPLYAKRQRRRGYNQAEFLARELGELRHLPVVTNEVARERYKAPESLRRRRPETEPVRAISGSPPVKKVDRVLVVDDIYTTGSTIEEVGRALKSVGVEEIYFLTVSTSWASE